MWSAYDAVMNTNPGAMSPKGAYDEQVAEEELEWLGEGARREMLSDD